MGRPRVDPIDRFNPSVVERFNNQLEQKENGCIEWTGVKDKDGYGRFTVGGRGGKKEYAHRWSLEHSLQKELPPEVKACHHCDNPSCVNPGHLFEGTQKDNMQDAVEKGRAVAGMGMCKFTDQQVLEIRSSEKTISELCSIYDASKPTIIGIRKLRTYKHVK